VYMRRVATRIQLGKLSVEIYHNHNSSNFNQISLSQRMDSAESDRGSGSGLDPGGVNFLPMDSVEGIQEFVTGEVIEQKEIKIKDGG